MTYQQTNQTNPEWRFIPLETRTAFLNMALDEACAEQVALGKKPPTIRFYRWKPSAVSIGYFQGLEEEVDTQACEKIGIDVVRRRTGGGAVYHDYEGEITYSVIAPRELFDATIQSIYQQVTGWMIKGFKQMNLDAQYVPINDVIISGQKISGNALTIRNNVVQMHGTILFDVDVEKMFSLLKVPDAKMKDKIIQNVKERVTSLKKQGIGDYMDVYEKMSTAFLENKEWKKGKWSKEEMSVAKQLAEEKYSTKEWVGQR